CDLLVIVGTSGTVQPAAGLVGLAPEGAVIVEINPERSATASPLDFRWRSTAARALPTLTDALVAAGAPGQRRESPRPCSPAGPGHDDGGGVLSWPDDPPNHGDPPCPACCPTSIQTACSSTRWCSPIARSTTCRAGSSRSCWTSRPR